MDIPSRLSSRPDLESADVKTVRRGRGIKAFRALSLALAIYGLVAWIYVAICSLAVPDTLALPLTHLLPWLREDTSGVLSFIISFVGFVSYRMISCD
jgi:hypothetical protein